MSSAPRDVVSTLLGLPEVVGAPGWRVGTMLVLEGAFFTSLALAVAHGIRVPQSGFFAIFLAAAGLAGRLDGLLDENRRAIVERGEPAPRVNAGSAAHLLSLFLGRFAAFAGAALWLGEAGLAADFGFVQVAAGLESATLFSRTFGSAPALLAHNATVLLLFVALAFIYRGYGALLALTWNACVWGLTLAFLVRRAVVFAAIPGPAFVGAAFAAVLPHLVLEAAGYVAGALGGIFLSRAVARYEPGDPVFRRVLRAVGALLAVAVGSLAAGALVEAWLPARVLGLLER